MMLSSHLFLCLWLPNLKILIQLFTFAPSRGLAAEGQIQLQEYLESGEPEENLEMSHFKGRTWLCSCEAVTLQGEGKLGERTAKTTFFLPRLRGGTPPKGFFEILGG